MPFKSPAPPLKSMRAKETRSGENFAAMERTQERTMEDLPDPVVPTNMPWAPQAFGDTSKSIMPSAPAPRGTDMPSSGQADAQFFSTGSSSGVRTPWPSRKPQ